MAVSTASRVYCPNCGYQTHTYCSSGRRPIIKIRYRKCRKCDTRISTTQRLDVVGAVEEIQPNRTEEEINQSRSELCSKYQRGRRDAMNQIKLTERDVAEIKFLIHNDVQTQAYTAMQYGVEKTAIHRIVTGACFADIPIPRSLADL